MIQTTHPFVNVCCALLTVCALAACGAKQPAVAEAPETPEAPFQLANETDSLSYGLGLNIAENLRNQGLDDVSPALMAQGIQDYLDGNGWEKATVDQVVNTIFNARKEREMAGRVAVEQAWLDSVAQQPGVVTTDSGLMYKVLVEGTGAAPDGNDKVTVHYTGSLVDGSVFDSSVQKGSPATFGVNQVIPGWTEGLQLMKEGGKTMFYIPQNLGYGMRPAPGGKIPVASALVFEVELFEVQTIE